MKKLAPPSSNSERIEGVRVTRDDLDFLIELFRRDVGPPALSDEHFEFESLDEFVAQRGPRPKMLEVEAKAAEGPYRSISAKFEGSHVWLHGSRDTPFHEAKEFIRSRCPWTFKILTPWPWFFLASVSFGVIPAVVEAAKKKSGPVPEWYMYLLSVPIAMMAISFFYRRFDFGLNLVRSHEGGFWRRNSEKIGLILIGAVISAGISWLSKMLGQ
ncbi:MAG: hypothetical protein VYC42_07920 [Pseudomonadota bacterium]|nr:hypothetical protein [Pseudomonadota bacterium]